VIQELRQEADTFHRKVLLSLRILVGLSCIMYALFYLSALQPLIFSFSSQLLFSNLQNNSLAIFPPKEKEPMLSAPLRIIFSMASFLIHYLLAVILSSRFRDYIHPYSDSTPVSYRFLYLVSVLAPTISFCSQIPWKVAIWWSYTPLIVFAVHRVMNNMEDINRGIANLEALKYRAPGA